MANTNKYAWLRLIQELLEYHRPLETRPSRDTIMASIKPWYVVGIRGSGLVGQSHEAGQRYECDIGFKSLEIR